jgi:hypothetical protein
MATSNITPNPGGTSSGDGGGTPASSPTQPVHSSDRALANYNSGDPAKGGAAPAVDPAKPAVVDPAKPAGGDPAPAGDIAGLDLAGLLGDDLAATDPAKPAVADPAAAAIDPNADPLEALKDNPRVVELKAAEAAVKDAMSASPEWIKEPAHLTAAVQDAAVLWDVTKGKQKVDVILDAAKANTPETYQQILGDLKAYLERAGIQVAAPAAIDPANMTPEQKQLAAIQKELDERKANDKKAEETRKQTEFAARINSTKKTILETKMPELLKDTIFEGEGELFLGLIGQQLLPKTAELIAAAEKGDFKMLETAVKVARSTEAKRFKARIDRAIELQKKKVLTIPKQPVAGAPAAGDPAAQPVTAQATAEARRKSMAAALKTGNAS